MQTGLLYPSKGHYKYPTYDKDIYSILNSCEQWKHYILGKEMIIHSDDRPLQFIQIKGKLQNNSFQYIKHDHRITIDN